MVNSPLIRPYLLGGVASGGGTLYSHDIKGLWSPSLLSFKNPLFLGLIFLGFWVALGGCPSHDHRLANGVGSKIGNSWGILGCPRKLGSMVSKWVITPIYPTHSLTIDPNFLGHPSILGRWAPTQFQRFFAWQSYVAWGSGCGLSFQWPNFMVYNWGWS